MRSGTRGKAVFGYVVRFIVVLRAATETNIMLKKVQVVELYSKKL